MNTLKRAVTILDVIDNWRTAQGIGTSKTLGSLSQERLSDLVRELDAFYAALPSSSETDEIRLLPAVWDIGNTPGLASRAVSHDDSTISELGAGNLAQAQALRRAYAAAFVCGDVVYDWDPLTPRIRLVALAGSLLSAEKRAKIRDLDVDYDPDDLPEKSESTGERWIMRLLAPVAARDRAAIDRVHAEVAHMRPLLDAGILVLVPAPFLPLHPAFVAHPESNDIGRLAAVAAARQGVSVIPLRSTATRSPEPYLVAAKDLDARVAESLAVVDLPILARLQPKTLVTIHQAEEAFGNWRATLRLAARQIHEVAGREGFENDARRVYDDVLLPRLNALKRTVSRSEALRHAIREEPVRAAFGAVFLAGTALTLGLSPAAALSSAAATAAADVAYAGLHRPGVAGPDAILHLLLRDSTRR